MLQFSAFLNLVNSPFETSENITFSTWRCLPLYVKKAEKKITLVLSNIIYFFSKCGMCSLYSRVGMAYRKFRMHAVVSGIALPAYFEVG